jgi:hypothetical protein
VFVAANVNGEMMLLGGDDKACMPRMLAMLKFDLDVVCVDSFVAAPLGVCGMLTSDKLSALCGKVSAALWTCG